MDHHTIFKKKSKSGEREREREREREERDIVLRKKINIETKEIYVL
tara:strand:- start:348 stop:485 length:138 start_codon:yes stop_codon:yes gene_type:complete